MTRDIERERLAHGRCLTCGLPLLTVDEEAGRLHCVRHVPDGDESALRRERLEHERREHRGRIARASVREVRLMLDECAQQLRNFAPHTDSSSEASTWNRAADELREVVRLLRGDL